MRFLVFMLAGVVTTVIAEKQVSSDDADIAQIKNEIESVYKSGNAAGSLVVGGETGRITEYDGIKVHRLAGGRDFGNATNKTPGKHDRKRCKDSVSCWVKII